MPGLELRVAETGESTLIYGFHTIAARMEESDEPDHKALTQPL
jgi:hypothetical protein